MPFNLRGGRPKNMGQGIYWVQRERAAGRSRASGELKVVRFNERFHRITDQFELIFNPYAGPKGTISVITGSKLDVSLDRYNDIMAWIRANINQATNADLSKLATAAKNILMEIAKQEGWSRTWDAASKHLSVNGRILDFS